jgi:hypothetical protein
VKKEQQDRRMRSNAQNSGQYAASGIAGLEVSEHPGLHLLDAGHRHNGSERKGYYRVAPGVDRLRNPNFLNFLILLCIAASL